MRDERKTKAQLIAELQALRQQAAAQPAAERWTARSQEHDEREQTIREKTAELAKIQEALRAEVEARQRTEVALQAAKESACVLIQSSLDMIIAVDENRRIIEFNRAAEQAFGYRKDEVLGRNVNMLYVDPNQGIWVNAVTIQGNGFTAEVRNKRKNGETFDAYVAASVMRDSAGRVVGVMGVSRNITEQKRAQAALRESEERYRDLVENINDIIFACDEQGRMTYVSPVVEPLSGYRPEELIGRSFTEFVHPDDVLAAIESYQRTIAGQLEPHEFRVFTQTGATRWVRSSSRPVVKGGRFVGLQGILTDITERKHAEHALQKACEELAQTNAELQKGIVNREHMAEALKERAHLATFSADVGAALTQSDSLQDMLQRCVETVVRHLGAAFARIWLLDTAEKVLELQASAGLYTHLNGPHSRVPMGETKIGRIAQDRRPYLSNAITEDAHVRDKAWARREGLVAFAGYPLIVENRLVGVIALFASKPLSMALVDALTSAADAIALGIEQKRAEVALQQSEEYFRALIENASDIVTILNSDGTVRYISPAVERMLGYTPETVVGRSLFEAVHQDDTLEMINAFSHAVQHPRVSCSLEFRWQRKDGSWCTLEGTGKSLLDTPGVTGVVLNIRDITERKRAEEERQQLQAQLFQAQKLEAIGTLAGGIAHDFNNVLSTILGFAELTLDEVPDESIARRNLEEILKACRRAKTLVQQLLTFSRSGSKERFLVELHPLIEETLTFLRPLLPSTVELRYRHTAPGKIYANPTEILQVLINLGINAVQAIGKQVGQITICLQPTEVEDPLTHAPYRLKSGPHLKLTVSDTGCGMPPEVMGRIFEPFFTTKPVEEGTGLGLAMVHGIVTSHGGAIMVESEAGQGTAFHVYFPLAQDVAVSESVASPSFQTKGNRL